LSSLRNVDDTCIYCNMLPGDECREDCFTNIFEQSLLDAPSFIPSERLIRQVSQLIVNEITTYMNMMSTAMRDLGNLGRVKLLARDFEDIHKLATALTNAGKLKDQEEVIKFYEDPTVFKNLSLLWNELGKPTKSEDETWQMFETAVSSYNTKEE